MPIRKNGWPRHDLRKNCTMLSWIRISCIIWQGIRHIRISFADAISIDRWTIETGDMGHVNESEMIEQMWPGGKQPVTDKPYFIVAMRRKTGDRKITDRWTFSAPMTVSFTVLPRASIVYTLETGDKPAWKLYNRPLPLSKGHSYDPRKGCPLRIQRSSEVQDNLSSNRWINFQHAYKAVSV